MHASLTLVTKPSTVPVTLAELKLHSRIDDDMTDDDALLMAYQAAVLSHLEGADGILGRALMTQTWDLKMDGFPPDVIRPKLAPLQSVSSITYIDTNGDEQTWASANYLVDTSSEPGRICPAYNASYPATRHQQNAVTVRFVAGYGDYRSDVPEGLRWAISAFVAHFYENREPVATGITVAALPMHLECLIAPYRLRWLA